METYMTNEEIGSVIRQARIKRGWTQTQLGEKLGVGAAAVNKWEMGTVSNVKREMLRNISVILGIHPAILIGMQIEEFFSDVEQREIDSFIEYIKSKRGVR